MPRDEQEPAGGRRGQKGRVRKERERRGEKAVDDVANIMNNVNTLTIFNKNLEFNALKFKKKKVFFSMLEKTEKNFI